VAVGMHERNVLMNFFFLPKQSSSDIFFADYKSLFEFWQRTKTTENLFSKNNSNGVVCHGHQTILGTPLLPRGEYIF
jgi:hypothetical protein